MSLYRKILDQLRLEEWPPAFYETGGLPDERYPRLHERQVERNNRAWAAERERQLQGHARRVGEHLKRHSRRPPPGEATNGRRQRVWCVDLRRGFDSVSAAGRFVGRAPSNVLQAIRTGVRCGGLRWEGYDPRRHGPWPGEPAGDPPREPTEERPPDDAAGPPPAPGA